MSQEELEYEDEAFDDEAVHAEDDYGDGDFEEEEDYYEGDEQDAYSPHRTGVGTVAADATGTRSSRSESPQENEPTSSM